MKRYIPDRRDKSNGNVGSIICWEVATEIEHDSDIKGADKHLYRMIISISTYGKFLINPAVGQERIDSIYKDVIENIILEQFYGELNENLIWYGLQQLSGRG